MHPAPLLTRRRTRFLQSDIDKASHIMAYLTFILLEPLRAFYYASRNLAQFERPHIYRRKEMYLTNTPPLICSEDLLIGKFGAVKE